MCFLIVIGFFITVAVWDNFGPIAGLISALLFMGGLGWKIVYSGLGFIYSGLNPKSRTFVKAWEERFGEMLFGQHGTYPPAGLFQQYMRESKVTGESPGEWLDRQFFSDEEN